MRTEEDDGVPKNSRDLRVVHVESNVFALKNSLMFITVMELSLNWYLVKYVLQNKNYRRSQIKLHENEVMKEKIVCVIICFLLL